MTRKTANSTAAEADVEALKKEIETLKQDLLRLTETVGKVGESKLKESVDEVKEKIVSQIPPEQLEAAKVQGEEALEAIKRQQKEHPVGTLLVAAGIGFLLGKVLGGRDL